MTKKTGLTVLAFSLSLAALSGCSPDSKSDFDGAKNTLNQDAKHAGQSITEATDKAGKALKNDETSASVKEALMTSKGLSTDHLKVDTNGKVVTLSGWVPTNDQKKRAVQIAKGIVGPDYKVTDWLKVGNG